jgi:hypothetical protein
VVQLKSTGVARKYVLWETLGMKKPHLVILKSDKEYPTLGGCSACEDVTFETNAVPIGSPAEHLSNLEKQFQVHFRDVHMREDASQMAARIVREATE